MQGSNRGWRIAPTRSSKTSPPKRQAAAKRLFVSLVTPGEGREDTRGRIEHAGRRGDATVVQTFAGAEARLSSADEAGGSRSIEVSHEALIRHWEKLREWMDENRENLRIREYLRARRKDWMEHDRDPEPARTAASASGGGEQATRRTGRCCDQRSAGTISMLLWSDRNSKRKRRKQSSAKSLKINSA